LAALRAGVARPAHASQQPLHLRHTKMHGQLHGNSPRQNFGLQLAGCDAQRSFNSARCRMRRVTTHMCACPRGINGNSTILTLPDSSPSCNSCEFNTSGVADASDEATRATVATLWPGTEEILALSADAAVAAGFSLDRRSALAAFALLPGPSAAFARATKPTVVLDRAGAAVLEGKWLATHTGPDLVLGLDGEPYFLLIKAEEPGETDDGVARRALQPFALRAECTHLGCLVAVDPGSGGFSCPCHGSRYAADGGVLRGPAPASLRLARVSVREDAVLVMSPWSEGDFRQV